MKRLCVEHSNQKIEGVVVAVRDNTENRLLPVSQLLQLQIIPAGEPLDFREGKHRQTDSRTHQNALGSFAGGLLKNVVFPNRNVIRFFLFKRLKQQIQRRLVLFVLFFCAPKLNHRQKHLHILFLWRRLVEQIEHEGGKQGRLGFFPKRVRLVGILGRGILDEVVNEAEHIGVFSDVMKGIVAIRVLRVYQVKDTDRISLL